MQTISVQELHDLLPLPESAGFIDVRTTQEYDAGHAAGTQNIPLDTLAEHIAELENYDQIYVICQSGGRSMSACMFLEQAGVTQVTNVIGGTTAWGILFGLE